MTEFSLGSVSGGSFVYVFVGFGARFFREFLMLVNVVFICLQIVLCIILACNSIQMYFDDPRSLFVVVLVILVAFYTMFSRFFHISH